MSSKAENVASSLRLNPIDESLFCRACARYATGVIILTVLGPHGAPHGMTANSFTSISLAPPLVLVAVDHKARMLGYLRGANYFGVSVLAEDQQALSAHFARLGQDRFTGVEWHAGTSGVPLIPGSLAQMECGLRQMVEAGDHTIFIGEVLRAAWREGAPLLYFSSGYRQLR